MRESILFRTQSAGIAGPREIAVQGRSFVDESVDWISDNLVEIAIALAAGLAIVAVLQGARLVGKRLCRVKGEVLTWRAVLGRVLSATTSWFSLAVAAEIVTHYADAPATVRNIVHLLFVVAAALQAAIWTRELVMGAIEHRAGAHDSGGALGSALGIIRLLLSIAVFGIAALTILGNLGVDVTGLVAGLGIGGIAIGLAAQGIFSDLFAAISILFDRPFRRGDTIRWDTTTGKVEAIGLKSTRVRALSGEEVVIANTNLLGKELHNMKRLERRRVSMTVGITYETPRGKVSAVPDMLRELVEAEPNTQVVRTGLVGFGASSLDFELTYDVHSADYEAMFGTRHRVNLAILERFAAEGISIAYPTQVTYLADPDGKIVSPVPEQRGRDEVDAPAVASGGRVARLLSRA